MNEEEQLNSTEVRVTNEYYNRILLVEYCQLFFALFGVALSMIINEIKINLHISSTNEDLLNVYITISSFALVYTIYLRYIYYLKWQIYRGLLTEYDTLISTGWWTQMVTEQIMMLIAPYPGL